MIIRIYNGIGVSEASLKHAYHTFQCHVSPKYSISYISPEEIIRGMWIQKTHLLVIPGGADQYYARALNGQGNNLIKRFVIQGGHFLGICAGSYYGGNYVEFAKSSNIEVTDKRALGLYNGTVRGPILCDYYILIKAQELLRSLYMPIYINI